MTVAAIASRGHDRVTLRKQLQRLRRVQNLKAFALMLPLLIFTGVIFAIPIGLMLTESVANVEMANAMPRTAGAIKSWTAADLPDEEVFAALATDLKIAYANKTITGVGARLNYEIPGFRTVINK